MRIGTDVNGVLVDMVSAMGQAAAALFHKTDEDLNWNLYNGGMTATEVSKANDMALTRLDPLPYGEALAVLQEWSQHHELVYITARRSMQDAGQINQLIRNKTYLMLYSWFPPGEVIFTGEQKAAACRAAGIDLMIEDRLESAMEIDPVVSCYLLDRPWNRHGDWPRPAREGT